MRSTATAVTCCLVNLPCAVCAHEGIDTRFKHLDTTSFSLTGDYVPDSDEHAIAITHGYSKDHRPDLKQAVLELMVSQDGGVPLLSKSWDGNTSDIADFPGARAGPAGDLCRTPRARATWWRTANCTRRQCRPLDNLGFITRIPGTLKLVSQVITQALAMGHVAASR